MNFQKDYDVIVAGGGIAGVAAALAASARGSKTALIEKTVYPGGLATTGLVYIYLPLCDGYGTQVTFGLTEKLLIASLKYGPGDIPENWSKENNAIEEKRYEVVFNPASFILAMDELLEESGVDVWYDTTVTRTFTENNIITGIEVFNKSGFGRLHAKVLIDATGDADLAHYAGLQCPTRDNALAAWTLEHIAGETGHRDLAENVKMRIVGCSNDKRTGEFLGIDGAKVSNFICKGRKKYRELLTESYESGRNNRKDRFPLFLPAMAQFRMSRRIDGEFTLNDGMEWTSFEDSVGMVADWRKSGYVWEIPYRSLLPRGLDNLLAVGRCMASEGDAWDVTRVIPTAAMTGEAAGVAAAMTVEKRTTTHQLSVTELQQQLSSKCGFPLHFEDVGTSRPEK